MHKEIIDKLKPELDKVAVFLKTELDKIRTSRPPVGLIEDIQVDYFGTRTPLKHLSVISITGARSISIQPWDKQSLPLIEKAISSSNIGVNPIAERDIIRLNFPPLSEEYRKDMVKALNNKMEEGRNTIRRLREESWKRIQDFAKEGKIREDDKFKAKEDLQKAVDETSRRIEEMGEAKRKEIEE